MTAAQLIARAEAALRTNQPNLATLYMRRASDETLWDRLDNSIAHFEVLRKAGWIR